MRKTLLLGILLTSFTVRAGTLDNWVQVRGGSWNVPDGEVAEMASKIQAAATSARGRKTAKDISTYVVQFKGIGPSGRRNIELRGSCEVDGRSQAELRKGFVYVLDGGECYFSAIWDAKARKFKNFQFNGVA